MFKERYLKQKESLLNDKSVNFNNKKIIEEFFKFLEYKLKRKNDLPEVDERSYKTLYFYVGRIRTLNIWFKNKDWKLLTEKEIKKLIDDLEDGKIKNKKGERFADRSLYYQMLQGKLFGLANKDDVARKILKDWSIKGRQDNNEVRFITEETFRKIVDNVIQPKQKVLLWLAFDIGENIGTLLELQKKDFITQQNEYSKEAEYLVVLQKEKLKRSRTPRSEITNYKESVLYLDEFLKDLEEEDKLFDFGITAAQQFFRRAVKKINAKCISRGQVVTLKDLRSSMACDLLMKGWTTDEVNARLGHKPSSRVIDKYINYLALDKNKPKVKVYQNNLAKLEAEIEEFKEKNKLQELRMQTFKTETEEYKNKLNKYLSSRDKTLNEIEEIKNILNILKPEKIKTLFYKKI